MARIKKRMDLAASPARHFSPASSSSTPATEIISCCFFLFLFFGGDCWYSWLWGFNYTHLQENHLQSQVPISKCMRSWSRCSVRGILLPRTCFEADFFFVFVSRRKDFGFGISAGMLLIELNKSRGRWLCALECEVNLAESARCVTVYPVPTLLLPLTSTTCNKCNNGNDSYYSGGFEAQYSWI